MQLKLSECVPIYKCKGTHYIPIKGCNQVSKDACYYTDIAMDEVDKFLVDFSFTDFQLDIYGKYRDVTFIPWLHDIENLLNFNPKQARLFAEWHGQGGRI